MVSDLERALTRNQWLSVMHKVEETEMRMNKPEDRPFELHNDQVRVRRCSKSQRSIEKL